MINISVTSLSIYLAIAILDKSKKEDMFYPLMIIITSTLLVSIITKLISTSIFMSINRNFHDKAINSMIKA
jgi:hypothetical protein